MRAIIFIVGMSITEAIYLTNGMEFPFTTSTIGGILFAAFLVDIVYLTVKNN